MTQLGSATGLPVVASGMLDRSTLRDQAVEVLRDQIVRGVVAAGARLNEVELAAMLGISRGPLREGIQRLAAEGLIEFRHNRGAFVREVSRSDVEHMFELRELLEVPAAKLAAIRSTESEIEELEAEVEMVDGLLSANSDTAYPVELDFHQQVLHLSKNPYLQRAGTDLQMQVRIARLRSGSSPERAREALDEHRSVLAAIASRRKTDAAKAMSIHLRNSLAHTLENWQ